MIIDAFSHIYTKEYLKELRRLCPVIRVEEVSSSRAVRITDLATSETLVSYRLHSGFDDPSRRVSDLNKYGIDRQVLTLGFPGIDAAALHASPGVTARVAKVYNNSIAEVANRYPERFVVVGEVPVLKMDVALDEMDRVVKELGAKGVQIYSTVGGKPLDLPEFRPFFERAQKLGVPVLIHPTNAPTRQRRSYERDFELPRIFGWPFETSLCITRLVFSGLLEECPSLRLIVHHAGAMVPFFSERLRILYRGIEKNKIRSMTKEPMDYFRMMYYDTATYGSVPALDCAAAVFGIDRLIHGTDYPFGPEEGKYFLRATKEAVQEISSVDHERETIYSGNALRLFGP